MEKSELLKTISIRGRFAIGIRILEALAKEDKNLKKAIIILHSYLWDFIQSKNLDVWHEKVEIVLPPNIITTTFSEANNFLTKKEFEVLKSSYLRLEDVILKIIEDVIWIGISNLYGGVGQYSEISLQYIESVIESAEHIGVEFSSLENFQKFAFSRGGGWGEIFTKEDVPQLT